MKRVVSILLVCIFFLGTGCSNPKRQTAPAIGRYYLAKEGSTSYIEVLDNNRLLFSNVRFADLEEDFYESAAIAFFDQKNEKDGITLTDSERDARIREIRDGIDLDKQFSGKASPFEYVKEDGEYGFTAVVNGSAMWLVVVYQPDHKELIFNEHMYVLGEGA